MLASALSSCAALSDRTLATGSAVVDSFGAVAMALWTGEHEVVGELPDSCYAFIDELFSERTPFEDGRLTDALIDLALNDTAIGKRCGEEYRARQAGPNPVVIVRDLEPAA